MSVSGDMLSFQYNQYEIMDSALRRPMCHFSNKLHHSNYLL